MTFTNVTALHFETKKKIDELVMIADTLLSGHKSASDIIDPLVDHRKKYVEQLQELNDTISSIVDTHSVMSAERLCQNVATSVYAIATADAKN